MLDPLGFDLNGVRVRREKQPPGVGVADPFQHLAVCPFRVVIDSREQLPYSFTGLTTATGEALVVPTVVRGLASGDYSIEGIEKEIAVERKSLDDCYGSVTWGRDRFEREVARLDDLPGGADVVIEATWLEVVAPAEYRPGWTNRTDPQSVVGTIIAWRRRYPRVHWWACGDRRGAEKLTFSILRQFWKEQNK